MIVQHNLVALNANRQLNMVSDGKGKTTEKLSSGFKINRAADDAAGLAISEKMRRQIRGLTQASANAQDGISLVQVADGALNEQHEILQRMNELSVKASNGTLTADDRSYIQSEMDALVDEIDRIANATTFNEDLYPLKGGEMTTPFIGEQEMTVNFQGSGTLTMDGQTYQGPCELKVTTLATLDDSGNFRMSPIFSWVAGGGGSGNCTATTFTCGVAGSTNPNTVNYTKPGEFMIDEDGYVLVKSASGPGPWDYVASNRQVHNVSSDGIPADAMKAVKADADPVFVHAGSENDEAMRINIGFVDATAFGLKLKPVDVTTEESAIAYVDKVKSALNTVSEYRADFGATQNRLEHTILNLDNVVENTTAAESAIRDTDMALAMVEFSNKNIIESAAMSLLAQANQDNQAVLSLLQ